ncbi:glycosyltransferase [Nocardioides litoris]|uniref:glycosyltransferase n=1 Tax=Nocardioides litoris TaxID=1926648 RepID=UPI00111ECE13|nr:glycosyltransferase family 2 protein [Nocardioides litoris]
MSLARWTVRAGAALSVASLGLTVDNLRRLRVPPAVPGAAGDLDRVAVLLPVRDEAEHVEACVRALLEAATHAVDGRETRARVVVLDDGSTDGTGEVLSWLQAAGTLEVVRGADLPAGWLGKPWACQQLADHVRLTGGAGGAEVLVFVDADVRVRPDALAATVALLRDADLDLVSPYPHQEARTVGERLVQPLLQWSWSSTLPLGLAETSPRPSLAAANGQLLAVRAPTYWRLGGHDAVRAEVVEDVALVRAVKSVGGRGGVADGARIASCRMYDDWPALREGYAKSLWTAFGSPAGAAGVVGLMVLAHVVPVVGALAGWSRAGLVGYAASVLSRGLVARRTGARVGDTWAHPVSVLVFAGLAADSVVAHRRGRLTWKGRSVA